MFIFNVEWLEGDLGGLIYVFKNNWVYINNVFRLFLLSFYIYNEGFFYLFCDVLLKDFFYFRIFLEGMIYGMDNLIIGGGVEFIVMVEVFISDVIV